MLYCYTPEMGEKDPTVIVEKQVKHLKVLEQQKIEMRASIGHYGNYYIDTKMTLKGRGIKLISDHYIHVRDGRIEENCYKVTDLAFAKLKAQYDIKMECHLD